ncbi:MAG: DNA translocase FtsK, partial [Erysipelotrichales bacterium]
NLDVEVSKINIGPAITKFELTLSAGTRVSRVASLADDIKMALAVKELRIEAPIPGKSAVGIEIPNVKNTLITLKEVLKDIDYDKENKLVFGLGKDINGKAIYTNLNKMPHLLVAGSTGSGKSVCINCIITSILMNAHYDDVKLLLVDPKKVELNVYNDIPHLLAPVVTDPKSASIALRKIVEEMDLRYQILANHNCKNIESYNEFVEKFNEKVDDESTKMNKLPYIVVIIDELADLMMVSPKEVEESIMRITQMARAAGIHLIVATQRPSTDVITGIIKANIPSRIAFAVSSSIDSRTILDMSGAEKLLGKGDMLFHPTGMSSPQRLQGAFLSDEEVEKVVRSIKKQNIESVINETFDNLNSEGNQGDNQVSSEDEIYFEVEDFVKRQDTISTSRLQREFKIGYNRAARLIDELEENGIIGAQSGSKPRDVFVRNEELE